MGVRRPPTFLLTLKRLGVGCGKKWYRVVEAVEAVGKRFQIEAAVEFNPETPKTRPEPDTTQIAAAFTSLVWQSLISLRAQPAVQGSRTKHENDRAARLDPSMPKAGISG